MANNLLTVSMITRKAVMIFTNTNMFLKRINRQYDNQYANEGEKIGSVLRIRLPNDYTVSTGPAFQPQDTAETQVLLTMATQNHVDVSFTSADLLLSLDDFAERILLPAMNNLAGEIAAALMTQVGEAACNLTANVDANNNVIAPTQQTFLRARAALFNSSAPQVKHDTVLTPDSMADTVSGLAGLLNPQSAISRQYMEGTMYDALGSIWSEDQSVINHTTGSFTAGTVNGASQTGTVLTTNAITGTLNVGDIITIAGVNGVNYVQKRTTGKLRQFVVTVAAASGATTLNIFPAIIPSAAGNSVQYQTVVTSPANGAAISLVLNPNITYSNNLRYAPEAITMATGDLPMPNDVKTARHVYDNVSMRYVQQYIIGSDQSGRRMDTLWGALAVRPMWLTKIPGLVLTS
jgi:coat protein Gp5